MSAAPVGAVPREHEGVPPRPLRIAFLGLPLAALLLRADGHEIVYAGVCRSRALGTRRLCAALGASRIDIVPNVTTAAVRERIAASAPDLLVSWFWTKRIPRRVLELAPLGAVGVHPSLLPRHRGPDPYFWAIASGDRETGVTAHRLDEEYDTGAILAQKRLAIDPSWSAWTLAKKLDRPSLSLLREVVMAFARGTPPPDVAQDPQDATLAPQPTDEDLEIRWRAQGAEEIVRLVRAASPWPGAFTEIAGATVTLTEARVAGAFPRALEPAEAAVVRERSRSPVTPHVVVRARAGAVELVSGRAEPRGEPDDVADLARTASHDTETGDAEEILAREDFVRLLEEDPVSS